MNLLLDIEDLLNANKVESDRIEFKEGWNPKTILRSICAFANDFENIGSGYILIGVNEDNGVAIRPVKGIPEKEIDKIQQDLQTYCRLISPDYFPRVSVEKVDNKHIIAIWVPAGTNRPYKVPDDVISKVKTLNYRIRWGTSSIVPNKEQELELIQLTAKIPFDDRVNQQALVSDLDFGLMREHLAATGSKLYTVSATMSKEELAEKMNLSSGIAEHLFPKNVGILMFTKQPTRYFKSAHIDIVEFPLGEGGSSFNEKIFDGPIQHQLKDALDYLKTHVIKSKIIKYDNYAKSDTVFNYPYEALEEVIPNAVYHRNYEENEPIEVRVLPDRIVVTSFNGADPSLKQRDFDTGTIRARRYRNRRIGEFLKELELTEGRGTGIPRMQNALSKNGSPKAIFDVDDPDRRYFVVEILCHPAFKANRETGRETTRETGREMKYIKGYHQMTPRKKEVLRLIHNNPHITYEELKSALGIKTEQGINNHINDLKKLGAIEREGTIGGRWIIHYE